jgi:hypothetical protein
MSNAFQEHRCPGATGGFKRVEVAVVCGDTDLLRRVAQVLAKDDAQAARMRTVLRDLTEQQPPVTFQEWLVMLLDDKA